MCYFARLLFLSLLCLTRAFAVPLSPEKVPQPLQPWIHWVLADEQDYGCPLADQQDKQCTWSGHLNLALSNQQGQFTSTWQLYREGWVALPGDEKHWPLNVTLNNNAVLVMNKDDTPMVKLPAGTHQLKGQFLWDNIPENLTIPEETGLIDLTINGKQVAFPAIKEGSLWLKESDVGEKKPQLLENKLDLQVFRQIDDNVPLQVVTFLELEVSGQQREIKLPHALLANFIPIKLQSPLPARIEANGSLTLQVRAGRWHLELLARHPKPLTAVGLTFHDASWVNSEIWVFNARPALRLVEIDSLPAIDPSQTNLPEAWKKLPAYQIKQGEQMVFKEIRRGDPEPQPNQLTLNRQLWLDFSGTGYTVQDQINGKMTNGWRLNALPEMQVGQVKLNGDSQLITHLPNSKELGVEVRQGQLDLKADSRLTGSIGNLNAVGWEQRFHQVNTTLRLPPGWRLLAVTGVDNDPDCWLSNWTLLDLFLVLIISLAVGKLWHPYWGGFALFTLMLIWHEPDAPQLIWINLIAALALLRVLPESKFFTLMQWYRNLCWLSLAFIVLPFLVAQVRIGLYPQLEKPWQQIVNPVEQPAAQPVEQPMPEPMEIATELVDEEDNADSGMTNKSDTEILLQKQGDQMTAMEKLLSLKDKKIALMEQELKNEEQAVSENIAPEASPVVALKAKADAAAKAKVEIEAKTKANAAAVYAKKRAISGGSMNAYQQQSANFKQIDPNANVPTGLGSPQWQWNEVQLSWNGAVDSSQRISLWYASPFLTMLLNFSRAITVVVLSFLLLGWEAKMRGWKTYLPFTAWLLIIPLTGLPSKQAYADFPPPEVLETLKARLLEAPDCVPQCVQIPRMTVTMTPEKLTLTLQVHAQQTSALPLPALYKEWLPNQVTIDGKIATAMRRTDEGALLLVVATGEHQVVLSGITPAQNKFTLPLPLKPHYVSTEAVGWSIEGVLENGEVTDQLQFNRIQTAVQQSSNQTLEQSALPAFIQIERTLELGLDWRLTTKVERRIGSDVPVLLEFPLLKGESVTTPDVRVKNGKVQVTMSANDESLQWESVLEKSVQIELLATKTPHWTEIWRADVSPIWHLQSTGISVVHHQNAEGHWLPEWRPWAGEKVLLTISRPVSINGRTLTIDSSHLELTPGKRSQEASLVLAIRSSKGTQHAILLPKNAQLQSVHIDGITQPIRQKQNQVTLPIKPGSQSIAINWLAMQNQATFLQTPVVNLGIDSVNSQLSLHLGQDRWVLFTAGSRFGPAVLFWGVLIVLAFAAIGLGKIQFTPLKHWHWFLLLIGLSQIPLLFALIVIAWLIALGLRTTQQTLDGFYFNVMQLGLGFLTVYALILLYTAVHHGLLESPDMQIIGNQSDAFNLHWYQDRSAAQLPTATVIMLPLMGYRVLMLLWSLWLAASLLNWLKWGWGCFSTGGLWKKIPPKKKSLLVDNSTPE